MVDHTWAAISLLAAIILVLTACTSPSQDGMQAHLEASLPVEALLKFHE
jgi:hypothetical protein